MCPLCHHLPVAWGQGAFCSGGAQTSWVLTPAPAAIMGTSPPLHCNFFCSWRGLGAVALPRALAHPWREPPVQILLAGVMLQPWHRSREDTSSDISVSKVVSRSPTLCPWCWYKTWSSLCRARHFSAQCPWLLLPVGSYLGRAEPTSGTESHSLGVMEPQNAILTLLKTVIMPFLPEKGLQLPAGELQFSGD